MFNPGDILDNRYEIISKVGQGGMSEVYKAKDLKLDRVVAIKILREEFASDEEFIERFRNEARSAAQLSHTNIVATYDIVNNNERHYIVMELVEGVTLKDYIANKGRLNNKETLFIAVHTAEGLSEAHRSHIIHRDIKSQNIIISKEGRIKIADFGIARAVTSDDPEKDVIGSAHYISPEQAETGEADERSDLYSLGICMYEMITGRLPFDGDNTVSVIMSHLQDALVPPSVYADDIYPALNDIIIKATRKNPEERYQTAAELISDLKRAANEPEGHYVKLFDSVASGKIAKETDGKENAGGDAVSLDRAAGAENNSTGKSAEETGGSDDGDQVYYDDSRTKFIILGITALILVLVALIAMFIVRTRNDAIRNAETATAALSSEASETETQGTDLTLSIKGESVMPDLLGLSLEDAMEVLAPFGLNVDSSASDYSDEYPKGSVMNQSPAKNEVLTEESAIYVTVSLGPRVAYILENLRYMTVDEAEAALLEEGITVSEDEISEFSDEVPEGLVVGYKDLELSEDGSRRVALSLSRGSIENYAVMPVLIGLTRADAAEILAASQLSLGNVYAINTSEAETDTIVSQSVTANEYIKKGSAVDLEICVGDDNRIPDGTVLTNDTPVQDQSGESGTESLSDEYYYGNIDSSCLIEEAAGPGASNVIYVAVRLVQRVEDSLEYTMLVEPIPVAPGTRIPVTFRNIRGAHGVEEGTIEVYSVDSGKVYSSYVIGFSPVD